MEKYQDMGKLQQIEKLQLTEKLFSHRRASSDGKSRFKKRDAKLVKANIDVKLVKI